MNPIIGHILYFSGLLAVVVTMTIIFFRRHRIPPIPRGRGSFTLAHLRDRDQAPPRRAAQAPPEAAQAQQVAVESRT